MSEEDDILAAELTLGVLTGSERTVAEARRLAEPGFAELVRRWDARLTSLPPDGGTPAWSQIEAAVLAQLPANDLGTPGGAALRRWKLAAVGFASAAAVLLALLITTLVRQSDAGKSLVATLAGPDQAAVVAVGIDADRQRLIVQPSALTGALAGRVAELWVIPADGRPRSLGVIDPAAARARATAEAMRVFLSAGATLAVSLEPQGGSPTGQPTGPVVLTGRIVGL